MINYLLVGQTILYGGLLLGVLFVIFIHLFLDKKSSVKISKYRSYLLTNKICIILSVASSTYLVLFLIMGDMQLIIPELITLISFLISLFLNKIGFTNLSRLSIIAFVNLAILHFASIMGDDTRTNALYFATIWIPLFLFEKKEKYKILYGILFSIGCQFFIHFTEFRLSSPYEITGIFREVYIFLILSITFLLNIGFSYSFFSTQYKYEKELKEANDNLEERSKRDAEYKLARQFQERYLPELYSYKEIKPSVIHEPSSRMVSGDFYDLRANGNNLGYFIVDVAGKGIESSYIAIQLHMILRTKITGKRTPKKIMEVINQEVKGLKALKKMCVGAYINVNLKEKKITYSRAGIDILWAIRENKIIDLDENSPPIGFGESNEFVEGEFKYNPEDIIISSTDGILDAKNEKGERYGETRLREVVRNHQVSGGKSLREAIYSDFKTHIGKEPLIDDLTVLILEIGDFRRF